MLHAMFLSLPGTPIVYYGDEIGMGDNIWLPDRHGCRTPMQWDASKNAGFSTADETYFPVHTDDVFGYEKVNVAAQEDDPESYLGMMRFLLETRRGQVALRRGDFGFVEVWRGSVRETAVLAYTRQFKNEQVLCVFNLSDQPKIAQLVLPGNHAPLTNLLSPESEPVRDVSSVKLAAYEACWFVRDGNNG
ncbi:MAG: DUF3459 domain-containing protein [Chloroflexi bacterium]|nr:MAG: DUF3459 domain-containing protein [Chloroflexota bacterium]